MNVFCPKFYEKFKILRKNKQCLLVIISILALSPFLCPYEFLLSEPIFSGTCFLPKKNISPVASCHFWVVIERKLKFTSNMK